MSTRLRTKQVLDALDSLDHEIIMQSQTGKSAMRVTLLISESVLEL